MSSALTISSISASGDYSQTSTCGTSLAAGASCTISVAFTPIATGARTGTLTITDNASNSPQTVSLTGTGVLQATVSPASLSFGNQAVGTSSTAKTVTLKNNLPTALTISSITASGDYAESDNCGTSLAAAASCTISVTFTPTTTGSRTGTLTITDSANNSPQTVSLTGNGVVPMKVTPATLSFGNQAVATSSSAKAVTVANNQPTAVSITSITTPGAYTQTNTCGTLLAAQSSCTVSVTFSPAATGSQPGTLTVTDSASNSPQTVSLTGTGVLQATATPASLSFGNEAVGTSSAAKTATLTNNLATALTISSITASGDYAESDNCGTSLAAGTNCTISVIFTPATTGSRTGTLTITDIANNSPQTVSLTGSGVVPVSVSPTTLAFGNQAVTTTSAAKTVTVSNKQPTAVTITSITTPAAYAQANTCGTLLAAQGTCTVSVTFSPTTTGSQPGTLTITDNASNSPQTVKLTGTGTALPVITGLSATSGVVGTAVTITGTGFGGSQGASTVMFNGVAATPTSWKSTSIAVTVPAAATTGNVVVTVNGGSSNGVAFTVVPNIVSLSATSGIAGTSVTITGSGFGSAQGSSTVTFSGVAATPTIWSATSITVPVPAGATGGNGTVVVTVSGVASNGVAFTVVPNINSLSLTSGVAGTSVTITGSGFGGPQGSSTITFNGVAASASSWTTTTITASVPSGAVAGTGTIVVTVGGVSSSGVTFMVVPAITNLSVGSGIGGAPLTITGTGFGASQGASSVLVSGTPAVAANWSTTSITVTIPTGATGGIGNVIVNVGGAVSNGVPFTVVPNVTGLSPTSGVVGSQVTIGGTGFGSSQGSNTVAFNDTVTTTVASWSSTSIVATVPTGATTGNVVVTVGGIASNGLNFVVSPVTTLQTSRYQHSATLLNSGLVLVVGGVSCPSGSSCTYLNSAELYNPVSGLSANTGSPATGRSAPAVLLPNGNVLIAGGANCNSSGSCASLSSAEIYNPASGTFASAGSMNVARDGHTMTLLGNGTVLIAGGETCSKAQNYGSRNRPLGRPLHHEARLIDVSFTPVIGGAIFCSAQDTAEVYDPVAGTFTYANGSLNVARYNAAATLLVNGQVLIVGGSNESNALSSAEIYDLSAGSFTQTTGSLATARTLPTATLFNNGLVLVAGGSTCDPLTCPTNTAELYNATTNTFQATVGPMNVARVGQTATLLTNGQVVLTGGNSSCQSNPCTTELSTETYDPVASVFTTGPAMTTARTGHSATLLLSGSVLLVGGMANGATLSSIEPYQPSSLTPSGLVSITVAPASSSVGVGDAEQFTATGTFTGGSTSTLQSVIWSSSSGAVASIDNSGGSAGFAYGLSVGSTTITATAGTISGSATLSIQQPAITGVSPSIGAFGTPVTISGTNFGSEQASGNVTIGGAVASVISWTNSSIVVAVPGNAPPGVAPGGSEHCRGYNH